MGWGGCGVVGLGGGCMRIQGVPLMCTVEIVSKASWEIPTCCFTLLSQALNILHFYSYFQTSLEITV